MPAVEDRVLQGLTWEEVAGIPDEDLRRKAVSLKKAATTPESNQLPPGAPEPPAEPALYAYLDSRMRGSSHATALSQAATGRWSYAEGAQRLKEAARKHWSQLPNDSPPSIRQYVWELAQSGAERPASGEGAGRGLGEPQHPWIPHSASMRGPPVSGTDLWPASGPGAFAQSSLIRDDRTLRETRTTPESLFRAAPREDPLRLPDAAGALANATRAFRAGSYTDGEPPANDETARALQAIAKSLTSKEDSLAQERGKLSSIGRLEERLVFLLRGCDTLRVTLCPGVVGKELYHALRIAGTQARPQLRRIEFPCNIQNRHSYGFAALQLGGKTLATIPDYCLSAGDFPLTSEEDFDNFGGTPDLKLEKKGEIPQHPHLLVSRCPARGLGFLLHLW